MTYFGAAFFASRCFSLFLAVAGGESQKISQFGRVPCSLEQTGDIRDIRCIRCVAKCGEMLQIVQAIGFIGFIGCSEPVKILKKQGRSAGPSSKIRKIQRYPKYSRLNMLALVPSTAISVAFVVRRVLSCCRVNEAYYARRSEIEASMASMASMASFSRHPGPGVRLDDCLTTGGAEYLSISFHLPKSLVTAEGLWYPVRLSVFDLLKQMRINSKGEK